MSVTTVDRATPEVPKQSPAVKPTPTAKPKAPARKAAKPAARKPSTPAVPPEVRAAQRKAEAERVAREAKFQAAKDKADHKRWEREERARTKSERKVLSSQRAKDFAARAIPYTPLYLANAAAMLGQLDWGLDHLTPFGDAGSFGRIMAAVIYAAVAESIALFLQYYAARALRNGDAAGALYLASFIVAGLVGAVNYSHYANAAGDGLPTPTATAVIFAMCSMISPWLWRIRTRAEHRDELKQRGEIDSRMVRLAMARKVFHPVRTFGVLWYATWDGVTNPAEAVALYERKRAEKAAAKRDRELAKRAEKAAPAPAPEQPKIKAEQVPNPRPVDAPKHPAGGRNHTRNPKWNEGVAIYEAALDAGKEMSVAELCEELGRKNKSLPIAIRKFVKARRASQAKRANQSVTT